MLALTAVSGALGAHLSGLLAPFPIITSVLAVFTHAHGGPPRSRVLLRNFLLGFYGFAAFCFVLAIALPAMSTAAAFGLATRRRSPCRRRSSSCGELARTNTVTDEVAV